MSSKPDQLQRDNPSATNHPQTHPNGNPTNSPNPNHAQHPNLFSSPSLHSTTASTVPPLHPNTLYPDSGPFSPLPLHLSQPPGIQPSLPQDAFNSMGHVQYGAFGQPATQQPYIYMNPHAQMFPIQVSGINGGIQSPMSSAQHIASMTHTGSGHSGQSNAQPGLAQTQQVFGFYTFMDPNQGTMGQQFSLDNSSYTTNNTFLSPNPQNCHLPGNSAHQPGVGYPTNPQSSFPQQYYPPTAYPQQHTQFQQQPNGPNTSTGISGNPLNPGQPGVSLPYDQFSPNYYPQYTPPPQQNVYYGDFGQNTGYPADMGLHNALNAGTGTEATNHQYQILQEQAALVLHQQQQQQQHQQPQLSHNSPANVALLQILRNAQLMQLSNPLPDPNITALIADLSLALNGQGGAGSISSKPPAPAGDDANDENDNNIISSLNNDNLDYDDNIVITDSDMLTNATMGGILSDKQNNYLSHQITPHQQQSLLYQHQLNNSNFFFNNNVTGTYPHKVFDTISDLNFQKDDREHVRIIHHNKNALNVQNTANAYLNPSSRRTIDTPMSASIMQHQNSTQGSATNNVSDANVNPNNSSLNTASSNPPAASMLTTEGSAPTSPGSTSENTDNTKKTDLVKTGENTVQPPQEFSLPYPIPMHMHIPLHPSGSLHCDGLSTHGQDLGSPVGPPKTDDTTTHNESNHFRTLSNTFPPPHSTTPLIGSPTENGLHPDFYVSPTNPTQVGDTHWPQQFDPSETQLTQTLPQNNESNNFMTYYEHNNNTINYIDPLHMINISLDTNITQSSNTSQFINNNTSFPSPRKKENSNYKEFYPADWLASAYPDAPTGQNLENSQTSQGSQKTDKNSLKSSQNISLSGEKILIRTTDGKVKEIIPFLPPSVLQEKEKPDKSSKNTMFTPELGKHTNTAQTAKSTKNTNQHFSPASGVSTHDGLNYVSYVSATPVVKHDPHKKTEWDDSSKVLSYANVIKTATKDGQVPAKSSSQVTKLSKSPSNTSNSSQNLQEKDKNAATKSLCTPVIATNVTANVPPSTISNYDPVAHEVFKKMSKKELKKLSKKDREKLEKLEKLEKSLKIERQHEKISNDEISNIEYLSKHIIPQLTTATVPEMSKPVSQPATQPLMSTIKPAAKPTVTTPQKPPIQPAPQPVHPISAKNEKKLTEKSLKKIDHLTNTLLSHIFINALMIAIDTISAEYELPLNKHLLQRLGFFDNNDEYSSFLKKVEKWQNMGRSGDETSEMVEINRIIADFNNAQNTSLTISNLLESSLIMRDMGFNTVCGDLYKDHTTPNNAYGESNNIFIFFERILGLPQITSKHIPAFVLPFFAQFGYISTLKSTIFNTLMQFYHIFQQNYPTPSHSSKPSHPCSTFVEFCDTYSGSTDLSDLPWFAAATTSQSSSHSQQPSQSSQNDCCIINIQFEAIQFSNYLLTAPAQTKKPTSVSKHAKPPITVDFRKEVLDYCFYLYHIQEFEHLLGEKQLNLSILMKDYDQNIETINDIDRIQAEIDDLIYFHHQTLAGNYKNSIFLNEVSLSDLISNPTVYVHNHNILNQPTLIPPRGKTHESSAKLTYSASNSTQKSSVWSETGEVINHSDNDESDDNDENTDDHDDSSGILDESGDFCQNGTPDLSISSEIFEHADKSSDFNDKHDIKHGNIPQIAQKREKDHKKDSKQSKKDNKAKNNKTPSKPVQNTSQQPQQQVSKLSSTQQTPTAISETTKRNDKNEKTDENQSIFAALSSPTYKMALLHDFLYVLHVNSLLFRWLIMISLVFLFFLIAIEHIQSFVTVNEIGQRMLLLLKSIQFSWVLNLLGFSEISRFITIHPNNGALLPCDYLYSFPHNSHIVVTKLSDIITTQQIDSDGNYDSENRLVNFWNFKRFPIIFTPDLYSYGDGLTILSTHNGKQIKSAFIQQNLQNNNLRDDNIDLNDTQTLRTMFESSKQKIREILIANNNPSSLNLFNTNGTVSNNKIYENTNSIQFHLSNLHASNINDILQRTSPIYSLVFLQMCRDLHFSHPGTIQNVSNFSKINKICENTYRNWVSGLSSGRFSVVQMDFLTRYFLYVQYHISIYKSISLNLANNNQYVMNSAAKQTISIVGQKGNENVESSSLFNFLKNPMLQQYQTTLNAYFNKNRKFEQNNGKDGPNPVDLKDNLNDYTFVHYFNQYEPIKYLNAPSNLHTLMGSKHLYPLSVLKNGRKSPPTSLKATKAAHTPFLYQYHNTIGRYDRTHVLHTHNKWDYGYLNLKRVQENTNNGDLWYIGDQNNHIDRRVYDFVMDTRTTGVFSGNEHNDLLRKLQQDVWVDTSNFNINLNLPRYNDILYINQHFSTFFNKNVKKSEILNNQIECQLTYCLKESEYNYIYHNLLHQNTQYLMSKYGYFPLKNDTLGEICVCLMHYPTLISLNSTMTLSNISQMTMPNVTQSHSSFPSTFPKTTKYNKYEEKTIVLHQLAIYEYIFRSVQYYMGILFPQSLSEKGEGVKETNIAQNHIMHELYANLHYTDHCSQFNTDALLHELYSLVQPHQTANKTDQKFFLIKHGHYSSPARSEFYFRDDSAGIIDKAQRCYPFPVEVNPFRQNYYEQMTKSSKNAMKSNDFEQISTYLSLIFNPIRDINDLFLPQWSWQQYLWHDKNTKNDTTTTNTMNGHRVVPGWFDFKTTNATILLPNEAYAAQLAGRVDANSTNNVKSYEDDSLTSSSDDNDGSPVKKYDIYQKVIQNLKFTSIISKEDIFTIVNNIFDTLLLQFSPYSHYNSLSKARINFPKPDTPTKSEVAKKNYSKLLQKMMKKAQKIGENKIGDTPKKRKESPIFHENITVDEIFLKYMCYHPTYYAMMTTKFHLPARNTSYAKSDSNDTFSAKFHQLFEKNVFFDQNHNEIAYKSICTNLKSGQLWLKTIKLNENFENGKDVKADPSLAHNMQDLIQWIRVHPAPLPKAITRQIDFSIFYYYFVRQLNFKNLVPDIKSDPDFSLLLSKNSKYLHNTQVYFQESIYNIPQYDSVNDLLFQQRRAAELDERSNKTPKHLQNKPKVWDVQYFFRFYLTDHPLSHRINAHITYNNNNYYLYYQKTYNYDTYFPNYHQLYYNNANSGTNLVKSDYSRQNQRILPSKRKINSLPNTFPLSLRKNKAFPRSFMGTPPDYEFAPDSTENYHRMSKIQKSSPFLFNYISKNTVHSPQPTTPGLLSDVLQNVRHEKFKNYQQLHHYHSILSNFRQKLENHSIYDEKSLEKEIFAAIPTYYIYQHFDNLLHHYNLSPKYDDYGQYILQPCDNPPRKPSQSPEMAQTECYFSNFYQEYSEYLVFNHATPKYEQFSCVSQHSELNHSDLSTYLLSMLAQSYKTTQSFIGNHTSRPYHYPVGQYTPSIAQSPAQNMSLFNFSPFFTHNFPESLLFPSLTSLGKDNHEDKIASLNFLQHLETDHNSVYFDEVLNSILSNNTNTTQRPHLLETLTEERKNLKNETSFVTKLVNSFQEYHNMNALSNAVPFAIKSNANLSPLSPFTLFFPKGATDRFHSLFDDILTLKHETNHSSTSLPPITSKQDENAPEYSQNVQFISINTQLHLKIASNYRKHLDLFVFLDDLINLLLKTGDNDSIDSRLGTRVHNKHHYVWFLDFEAMPDVMDFLKKHFIGLNVTFSDINTFFLLLENPNHFLFEYNPSKTSDQHHRPHHIPSTTSKTSESTITIDGFGFHISKIATFQKALIAAKLYYPVNRTALYYSLYSYFSLLFHFKIRDENFHIYSEFSRKSEGLAEIYKEQPDTMMFGHGAEKNEKQKNAADFDLQRVKLNTLYHKFDENGREQIKYDDLYTNLHTGAEKLWGLSHYNMNNNVFNPQNDDNLLENNNNILNLTLANILSNESSFRAYSKLYKKQFFLGKFLNFFPKYDFPEQFTRKYSENDGNIHCKHYVNHKTFSYNDILSEFYLNFIEFIPPKTGKNVQFIENSGRNIINHNELVQNLTMILNTQRSNNIMNEVYHNIYQPLFYDLYKNVDFNDNFSENEYVCYHIRPELPENRTKKTSQLKKIGKNKSVVAYLNNNMVYLNTDVNYLKYSAEKLQHLAKLLRSEPNPHNLSEIDNLGMIGSWYNFQFHQPDPIIMLPDPYRAGKDPRTDKLEKSLPEHWAYHHVLGYTDAASFSEQQDIVFCPQIYAIMRTNREKSQLSTNNVSGPFYDLVWINTTNLLLRYQQPYAEQVEPNIKSNANTVDLTEESTWLHILYPQNDQLSHKSSYFSPDQKKSTLNPPNLPPFSSKYAVLQTLLSQRTLLTSFVSNNTNDSHRNSHINDHFVDEITPSYHKSHIFSQNNDHTITFKRHYDDFIQNSVDYQLKLPNSSPKCIKPEDCPANNLKTYTDTLLDRGIITENHVHAFSRPILTEVSYDQDYPNITKNNMLYRSFNRKHVYNSLFSPSTQQQQSTPQSVSQKSPAKGQALAQQQLSKSTIQLPLHLKYPTTYNVYAPYFQQGSQSTQSGGNLLYNIIFDPHFRATVNQAMHIPLHNIKVSLKGHTSGPYTNKNPQMTTNSTNVVSDVMYNPHFLRANGYNDENMVLFDSKTIRYHMLYFFHYYIMNTLKLLQFSLFSHHKQSGPHPNASKSMKMNDPNQTPILFDGVNQYYHNILHQYPYYQYYLSTPSNVNTENNISDPNRSSNNHFFTNEDFFSKIHITHQYYVPVTSHHTDKYGKNIIIDEIELRSVTNTRFVYQYQLSLYQIVVVVFKTMMYMIFSFFDMFFNYIIVPCVSFFAVFLQGDNPGKVDELSAISSILTYTHDSTMLTLYNTSHLYEFTSNYQTVYDHKQPQKMKSTQKKNANNYEKDINFEPVEFTKPLPYIPVRSTRIIMRQANQTMLSIVSNMATSIFCIDNTLNKLLFTSIDSENNNVLFNNNTIVNSAPRSHNDGSDESDDGQDSDYDDDELCYSIIPLLLNDYQVAVFHDNADLLLQQPKMSEPSNSRSNSPRDADLSQRNTAMSEFNIVPQTNNLISTIYSPCQLPDLHPSRLPIDPHVSFTIHSHPIYMHVPPTNTYLTSMSTRIFPQVVFPPAHPPAPIPPSHPTLTSKSKLTTTQTTVKTAQLNTPLNFVLPTTPRLSAKTPVHVYTNNTLIHPFPQFLPNSRKATYEHPYPQISHRIPLHEPVSVPNTLHILEKSLFLANYVQIYPEKDSSIKELMQRRILDLFSDVNTPIDTSDMIFDAAVSFTTNVTLIEEIQQNFAKYRQAMRDGVQSTDHGHVDGLSAISHHKMSIPTPFTKNMGNVERFDVFEGVQKSTKNVISLDYTKLIPKNGIIPPRYSQITNMVNTHYNWKNKELLKSACLYSKQGYSIAEMYSAVQNTFFLHSGLDHYLHLQQQSHENTQQHSNHHSTFNFQENQQNTFIIDQFSTIIEEFTEESIGIIPKSNITGKILEYSQVPPKLPISYLTTDNFSVDSFYFPTNDSDIELKYLKMFTTTVIVKNTIVINVPYQLLNNYITLYGKNTLFLQKQWGSVNIGPYISKQLKSPHQNWSKIDYYVIIKHSTTQPEVVAAENNVLVDQLMDSFTQLLSTVYNSVNATNPFVKNPVDEVMLQVKSKNYVKTEQNTGDIYSKYDFNAIPYLSQTQEWEQHQITSQNRPLTSVGDERDFYQLYHDDTYKPGFHDLAGKSHKFDPLFPQEYVYERLVRMHFPVALHLYECDTRGLGTPEHSKKVVQNPLYDLSNGHRMSPLCENHLIHDFFMNILENRSNYKFNQCISVVKYNIFEEHDPVSSLNQNNDHHESCENENGPFSLNLQQTMVFPAHVDSTTLYTHPANIHYQNNGAVQLTSQSQLTYLPLYTSALSKFEQFDDGFISESAQYTQIPMKMAKPQIFDYFSRNDKNMGVNENTDSPVVLSLLEQILSFKYPYLNSYNNNIYNNTQKLDNNADDSYYFVDFTFIVPTYLYIICLWLCIIILYTHPLMFKPILQALYLTKPLTFPQKLDKIDHQLSNDPTPHPKKNFSNCIHSNNNIFFSRFLPLSFFTPSPNPSTDHPSINNTLICTQCIYQEIARTVDYSWFSTFFSKKLTSPTPLSDGAPRSPLSTSSLSHFYPDSLTNPPAQKKLQSTSSPLFDLMNNLVESLDTTSVSSSLPKKLAQTSKPSQNLVQYVYHSQLTSSPTIILFKTFLVALFTIPTFCLEKLIFLTFFPFALIFGKHSPFGLRHAQKTTTQEQKNAITHKSTCSLYYQQYFPHMLKLSGENTHESQIQGHFAPLCTNSLCLSCFLTKTYNYFNPNTLTINAPSISLINFLGLDTDHQYGGEKYDASGSFFNTVKNKLFYLLLFNSYLFNTEGNISEANVSRCTCNHPVATSEQRSSPNNNNNNNNNNNGNYNQILSRYLSPHHSISDTTAPNTDNNDFYIIFSVVSLFFSQCALFFTTIFALIKYIAVFLTIITDTVILVVLSMTLFSKYVELINFSPMSSVSLHFYIFTVLIVVVYYRYTAFVTYLSMHLCYTDMMLSLHYNSNDFGAPNPLKNEKTDNSSIDTPTSGKNNLQYFFNGANCGNVSTNHHFIVYWYLYDYLLYLIHRANGWDTITKGVKAIKTSTTTSNSAKQSKSGSSTNIISFINIVNNNYMLYLLLKLNGLLLRTNSQRTTFQHQKPHQQAHMYTPFSIRRPQTQSDQYFSMQPPSTAQIITFTSPLDHHSHINGIQTQFFMLNFYYWIYYSINHFVDLVYLSDIGVHQSDRIELQLDKNTKNKKNTDKHQNDKFDKNEVDYIQFMTLNEMYEDDMCLLTPSLLLLNQFNTYNKSRKKSPFFDAVKTALLSPLIELYTGENTAEFEYLFDADELYDHYTPPPTEDEKNDIPDLSRKIDHCNNKLSILKKYANNNLLPWQYDIISIILPVITPVSLYTNDDASLEQPEQQDSNITQPTLFSLYPQSSTNKDHIIQNQPSTHSTESLDLATERYLLSLLTPPHYEHSLDPTYYFNTTDPRFVGLQQDTTSRNLDMTSKNEEYLEKYHENTTFMHYTSLLYESNIRHILYILLRHYYRSIPHQLPQTPSSITQSTTKITPPILNNTENPLITITSSPIINLFILLGRFYLINYYYDSFTTNIFYKLTSYLDAVETNVQLHDSVANTTRDMNNTSQDTGDTNDLTRKSTFIRQKSHKNIDLLLINNNVELLLKFGYIYYIMIYTTSLHNTIYNYQHYYTNTITFTPNTNSNNNDATNLTTIVENDTNSHVNEPNEVYRSQNSPMVHHTSANAHSNNTSKRNKTKAVLQTPTISSLLSGINPKLLISLILLINMILLSYCFYSPVQSQQTAHSMTFSTKLTSHQDIELPVQSSFIYNVLPQFYIYISKNTVENDGFATHTSSLETFEPRIKSRIFVFNAIPSVVYTFSDRVLETIHSLMFNLIPSLSPYTDTQKSVYDDKGQIVYSAHQMLLKEIVSNDNNLIHYLNYYIQWCYHLLITVLTPPPDAKNPGMILTSSTSLLSYFYNTVNSMVNDYYNYTNIDSILSSLLTQYNLLLSDKLSSPAENPSFLSAVGLFLNGSNSIDLPFIMNSLLIIIYKYCIIVYYLLFNNLLKNLLGLLYSTIFFVFLIILMYIVVYNPVFASSSSSSSSSPSHQSNRHATKGHKKDSHHDNTGGNTDDDAYYDANYDTHYYGDPQDSLYESLSSYYNMNPFNIHHTEHYKQWVLASRIIPSCNQILPISVQSFPPTTINVPPQVDENSPLPRLTTTSLSTLLQNPLYYFCYIHNINYTHLKQALFPEQCDGSDSQYDFVNIIPPPANTKQRNTPAYPVHHTTTSHSSAKQTAVMKNIQQLVNNKKRKK